MLVKQESTRKVGIALQPDEELLRGRLEVMHSQLNMPKQFKVSCQLCLQAFSLIHKLPVILKHYYPNKIALVAALKNIFECPYGLVKLTKYLGLSSVKF